MSYLPIENPTDGQIIEKVRQGDTELFRELVLRYQNKIFAYVYRFVNHKEEAEDIVQEVFLKVYKNLYGYDARLKFSSWLYRIAHNEAVNWLTKNSKYKKEPLEENDYLANTLYDQKDVIQQLDSKTDFKKVKQTIAQLPEKYREVIILKFIEEKSYEEISDILQRPVSTVGVLINRAKKMIKKRVLKG